MISEVHTMDIKKFEGSMSFDDFSNGIVSYGNCKTFGEVWEKCVTCNNCDHREACEAITDEYYGIKCHQVIDLLLGHKKLEDIIKEIK
jgi:hypothetical protein